MTTHDDAPRVDHRSPDAEPAEEREMFGLQNELLGEWYDHRDESPRVDA